MRSMLRHAFPVEVERDWVVEPGGRAGLDDRGRVRQGYDNRLTPNRRIAEPDQETPVRGCGEAFDVETARRFRRLLRRRGEAQRLEIVGGDHVLEQILVGWGGSRLHRRHGAGLVHVGREEAEAGLFHVASAVAAMRRHPINSSADARRAFDVGFLGLSVRPAVSEIVDDVHAVPDRLGRAAAVDLQDVVLVLGDDEVIRAERDRRRGIADAAVDPCDGLRTSRRRQG